MKGSNIKAMENKKDFSRGECFTFFFIILQTGKRNRKSFGKRESIRLLQCYH